ncbi:tyrosinase [Didymella exigua CBS 183.55]|uniref:tyrosinase n=1 Tax=Didymella exigua CBS 183.55 TaxID=1150837 RepID=A0A6A5RAM1_9PLEO|nr:tyrosinase [Didymella exigua CBS 183.55]KAF1925295.1 tyrosinase [Didymella exigua CBS 183.55]
MLASWTSWLVVASTLVSVTTCISTVPLNKRQSTEGIVTGIDSRDQNGNPFLRLEVRDMQANFPDQWNLYLIALDQLHTTDEDSPSSYYGLAKIHGRPYKTVLDAPGIPHKIGSTGYCPHSMALFLGWHRPYLALFEQKLYARIQILATHAPEDQRERYQWAAYSFRIPYWDWSLGDGSGDVPRFFVTETTVVFTPEGRNIEIWNPLYAYTFKSIPDGFEDKFRQMNRTVRWPASESPWENSRQNEFIASFANLRRQIQDQVAVAFRRTNFNGFWEAIEQVHGGHMWPLEYSSYEPLFWLHHANVDRLFALWQAQNPGVHLQRTNVGSAGNVFVEDNDVVDGDTPLLPFRRNPGSFWTTNEAMDWRLFGYDYTETRASGSASAGATVAQMYSGSTRGRLTATHTGSVTHHSVFDADEVEYTDWMINTSAAPLNLPSTFLVQFSLVGDFSSDASSNVGMWSVMLPTGHDKAKRLIHEVELLSERAIVDDMTLHGTVSLTSSLLDQIEAGNLRSLEDKDVVPFLKEKLSWKIYGGDGTQLPDSSLDSIRIDIASETAHIPSDPNAPIAYSNATTAHSEVTAGKMGGAN